ncbi:MAG: hypothetical protein GY929_27110 [Actinomycetia bacterium]|nr:hypothetical protein [Actinomycetes bacterium]MCP3911433.1 hypothetical protein [Actinomycetes bacterium]MCP5029953.1 hypothetical protein [Actinomycetes bacterium]
MARKTWTAAELEQMTPSEQDEIFQASIVRDLTQVPEDFLKRVRAKADQRIADSETPDRS